MLITQNKYERYWSYLFCVCLFLFFRVGSSLAYIYLDDLVKLVEFVLTQRVSCLYKSTFEGFQQEDIRIEEIMLILLTSLFYKISNWMLIMVHNALLFKTVLISRCKWPNKWDYLITYSLKKDHRSIIHWHQNTHS